MENKTTIDELAEMTQKGLQDVEQRLEGKVDGLRKEMHQGFETVLQEVKGLRDEVKIYHQGTRVEYSMLHEHVERLEERIKIIEVKTEA